MRQAIFSSLAAFVPGARVLDLYCGSGAYGLEALSRGADSAVFVDRDASAVAAAKANAVAAGLEEHAGFRRSDAGRYLKTRAKSDGPFDLVFADPPYSDPAALVAAVQGVAPAVPRGGRVVCEGRKGAGPPPPAAGYVLEADRRYGDTRVLVYRREED